MPAARKLFVCLFAAAALVAPGLFINAPRARAAQASREAGPRPYFY